MRARRGSRSTLYRPRLGRPHLETDCAPPGGVGLDYGTIKLRTKLKILAVPCRVHKHLRKGCSLSWQSQTRRRSCGCRFEVEPGEGGWRWSNGASVRSIWEASGCCRASGVLTAAASQPASPRPKAGPGASQVPLHCFFGNVLGIGSAAQFATHPFLS